MAGGENIKRVCTYMHTISPPNPFERIWRPVRGLGNCASSSRCPHQFVGKRSGKYVGVYNIC